MNVSVELTEAQSVRLEMTVTSATSPGVVVSVDSSDVTITSPEEEQHISDAVADVPIVAEIMCTQPTAGNEGVYVCVTYRFCRMLFCRGG